MKITQLQAYNSMYKLLEDYYKKTKNEDIMSLLPGMVFLADGGTADPAVWEDWLKAIENKKTLTKKEVFVAMIYFFEEYYSVGPYPYIKLIIDALYAAKDCNDVTVPLVKQWNFYLKEALSEPEGTKEYLSFGDPMQNITPLQGFNTVYKFLNYYCKQKKSNGLIRMTNNMLFLPEGGTVDPEARINWKEATYNKLTSTKQEVFDNTIKFLEAYGDHVSSSEAKSIAKELRSAKNCNDVSIPLVDLWNYCLLEALNEPGGAREYLVLTKE